jgi:hypothetical protein
MNTVTTRDIARFSTEGPIVASRYNGGEPWVWGAIGNLGATRTSRRAAGFGDMEILGLPWYLVAGIGVAALFILPKLLGK